MRITSILFAVVFAVISMADNSFSATYDATGQWTVTTSNSWVDQGNSGDCEADSNDTITITINQTGDTFVLTWNGKNFQGNVSGATYSGAATYPDDGGETTSSFSFTLTSETSGSGSSGWDWSDDTYYCSGGNDFSMSKSGESDDNAGSATYNATGDWRVVISGNWSEGCEGGEDRTITVSVNQTGDTFVLTMDGEEYQGNVSGSAYTGSTTYDKNGGTIDENVSVTLTSETSGSGSGEWDWSDGYDDCSGGYNLSMTKVGGNGGNGDSSDGGGSGGGCFIDTIANLLK